MTLRWNDATRRTQARQRVFLDGLPIAETGELDAVAGELRIGPETRDNRSSSRWTLRGAIVS